MTSQNRIPLRDDFVKSLRMLPNLSNDQLKQIASNNNDPLSTFAIAVLNSKQISANSSKNANQPTIANQVLAKENPSSGIASLAQSPTMLASANMQPAATADQAGVSSLPIRDDMFNEKNYANGGIVAFQEGGSSRISDYFSNLRAKNLETQEENKLINQLLSEKYRIEGDVFTALTPEQKAAQNNALKQIDAMLADAKARKTSRSSNAPTTVPGANVMGSQAAADNVNKTFYDPSQSLADKGAPYKTPARGGEPGVYDSEKIKSIGDYAKELQDYLGPDKNVALQRERLARMEDRASRMERDAPYLALTEAGLGMMAGTSPFALTNIGTGAQMGVKSYAAAQDKFAALEEKRLNLAMNIDQAERKERLASAEFGARSKEAAQERNFKRQLQREHDKVLMAMNTDDNMKALMAAEIRSQPDITQKLKLNEEINLRLPQEKKLILEELGGNADKPSSKNYSAYLNRLEQAKAKIVRDVINTPGLSSVSGSPVITKRAKFLGFE